MYDLACSFTTCQRCFQSEGIARVNKRICNFQCESSQELLFNVSGLLEWKELGLIDAILCVTDAFVMI
jgi:hypothetical protein